MSEKLENPWLVAAWPGMAGVAQIAGTYLIQKLGAEQVAEIDGEPWFDLDSVKVSAGVVQPAQHPRSVFYAWKNPTGGRDLVIFLGDKQPPQKTWSFCQAVLDVAQGLGVERLFTFAAMATPMHPTATPRVFAVCSRPEMLEETIQEEVTILKEGEISGLNGVLLAAAAERDIHGMCLLGEFPYFATPVPNPKASGAVLRVFRSIVGLELDLEEMDSQSEVVEKRLLQILEQLQATGQGGQPLVMEEEEVEFEEEREDDLDPSDAARLEDLFQEAELDRSKANELKTELDRLGVFKQFEDRFLDLFRRAE